MVTKDELQKTSYKCQVETYRGSTRIVGQGVFSPCGKPATILLSDGTRVCRYHSPESKAKREEAKELRWELQAMNRRKGIGRKQRKL